MFAGSASGIILPPFVVYKAEHVYDLWVQGGPPGARYSCSKSGWFDSTSFEEWFFTIALPYFRKLHTGSDKPFVLIGDNLSSHFSPKVLEACKTFNIAFKCLPANSTHLCQPLDVAFFGPLKRYWREILTAFKQKYSGRSISVSKAHFPALLNELMDKLAPVAKDSLQAGFRKCGLFPLNRNEVLRCLPEDKLISTPPEESMAESVLQFLKGMRYGTNATPIAAGSGASRKKRLNREPGKSVSIDDVVTTEKFRGEDLPSTSQSSKQKGRKRIASSSSSSTNTLECAESDEGTLEQMDTQLSEVGDENEDFGLLNETPQTDDWVLVQFAGKKINKHFIGKVIEAPKIDNKSDELLVSFVRKSTGGFFVWPDKSDISTVDARQVVRTIPEPLEMRRGRLLFTLQFAGFNVG